MTLQELINQAEDRDFSKTYPKADGLYIWDYKLEYDATNNFDLQLALIPSDTGKVGFRDKVSIQELIDYVSEETENSKSLSELQIVGVEGITIAKV